MIPAGTAYRPVYLIGPSGAGKSNGLAAARAAGIPTLSTDAALRGREFDAVAAEAWLVASDSPGPFRVIDIGAGTQTLGFLAGFLAERQSRVLLVMVPPDECLARNPLGPGRDSAEYRRTEYCSRMAVYGTAGCVAWVGGLDAEAAGRRVVANVLDMEESARA